MSALQKCTVEAVAISSFSLYACCTHLLSMNVCSTSVSLALDARRAWMTLPNNRDSSFRALQAGGVEPQWTGTSRLFKLSWYVWRRQPLDGLVDLAERAGSWRA